jgi:hypothetical protein
VYGAATARFKYVQLIGTIANSSWLCSSLYGCLLFRWNREDSNGSDLADSVRHADGALDGTTDDQARGNDSSLADEGEAYDGLEEGWEKGVVLKRSPSPWRHCFESPEMTKILRIGYSEYK